MAQDGAVSVDAGHGSTGSHQSGERQGHLAPAAADVEAVPPVGDADLAEQPGRRPRHDPRQHRQPVLLRRPALDRVVARRRAFVGHGAQSAAEPGLGTDAGRGPARASSKPLLN